MIRGRNVAVPTLVGLGMLGFLAGGLTLVTGNFMGVVCLVFGLALFLTGGALAAIGNGSSGPPRPHGSSRARHPHAVRRPHPGHHASGLPSDHPYDPVVAGSDGTGAPDPWTSDDRPDRSDGSWSSDDSWSSDSGGSWSSDSGGSSSWSSDSGSSSSSSDSGSSSW